MRKRYAGRGHWAIQEELFTSTAAHFFSFGGNAGTSHAPLGFAKHLVLKSCIPKSFRVVEVAQRTLKLRPHDPPLLISPRHRIHREGPPGPPTSLFGAQKGMRTALPADWGAPKILTKKNGQG